MTESQIRYLAQETLLSFQKMVVRYQGLVMAYGPDSAQAKEREGLLERVRLEYAELMIKGLEIKFEK